MKQEQQEILRQQVKIAKALNDDWNYKQMAEVIDISQYAFYNWLNGYYCLSSSKQRELQSLINDLIAE